MPVSRYALLFRAPGRRRAISACALLLATSLNTWLVRLPTGRAGGVS
jgi:hypothetical protein